MIKGVNLKKDETFTSQIISSVLFNFYPAKRVLDIKIDETRNIMYVLYLNLNNKETHIEVYDLSNFQIGFKKIMTID